MKLIIILGLFSLISVADDLIFKNGFEQLFTVGGSVTGLNSTGLNLTLNNGGHAENLPINASGAFVFNSQLAAGENWDVVITTQPTTQSCNISNSSGTIASGGVSDIMVTCGGRWNEMDWDTDNWQ